MPDDELTLEQIMAVVSPDETKAAIERQRQQVITTLADLKAQYAANAENHTLDEATRKRVLANLEQQMRDWHRFLTAIDKRLAASNESLEEAAARLWGNGKSPNRAARRRATKG